MASPMAARACVCVCVIYTPIRRQLSSWMAVVNGPAFKSLREQGAERIETGSLISRKTRSHVWFVHRRLLVRIFFSLFHVFFPIREPERRRCVTPEPRAAAQTPPRVGLSRGCRGARECSWCGDGEPAVNIVRWPLESGAGESARVAVKGGRRRKGRLRELISGWRTFTEPRKHGASFV